MVRFKKIIPKVGKEEKTSTQNLEKVTPEQDPVEIKENLSEAREAKEELSSKEIQQVREKIEKTELDDALKIQVASHAQDIKQLDEEKKIKKLLALAQSKGVIYAVLVAKKMDDPYLLDLLHDILAKEGYYKNFKP